jgi:hypothetical protein
MYVYKVKCMHVSKFVDVVTVVVLYEILKIFNSGEWRTRLKFSVDMSDVAVKNACFW